MMPVLASAQAIGGTVPDASRGAVPGVRVKAGSRALIEQLKTVITDAAVNDSIVRLIPRVYSVTLTLPGFATLRQGIVLTTGFTAAVDPLSRVGPVRETIKVTGASPIVNVRNIPKQDPAAASGRSQAPNLGRIARVLLAIALNVLLSATSSAAPLQAPAGGHQSQLKEAQALIKAVYATLRGRLDPPGRPLGWFHAFFKGESGNTYVPYTVTIPRSAVPDSTIAMYVFVTPHLVAGKSGSRQRPDHPAPAEPQAPAGPETAFEAIYFLDPGTDRASDAYRVSRAFAVPAGNYDVYVAVAATTAAEADAEPTPDGSPAKVMLIKQEVSVPDFWNTSLSTSTVVVAERVEPLTAPPTVEQQSSNPYALSGWHIVPARRTEFQRSDELSVIFFVYNAGLTSARKPDVTIEYAFYRRSDAREMYFVRTPPQHFNGSTMPSFSAEAGHQIIGGQAVPLTSFPEGAYRLEVKVVDKTNRSTVTRDVAFSVRDR